jgi:hypothetical protein
MTQNARPQQLQNNEESPDPAIAVVKWVQRLELVVSERGLNHWRKCRVGPPNPVDPFAHADLEVGTRWRWNEPRFPHSRTGWTDYDLDFSNPSGLDPVVTRVANQHRVKVQEKPDGYGTICYPRKRVLSGADVVENLDDLRRQLGTILQIGFKNCSERRIGTFESRSTLRFASEGWATDEGWVWNLSTGLIKAAQRKRRI